MALVRISERLLDETKQKINQMGRKAALNGYEKLNPESIDGVVDSVREAVLVKAFIEAPALRGAVPDSWLMERNNYGGKLVSNTPPWSHTVSLPGSTFVPKSSGSYSTDLNPRDVPNSVVVAVTTYLTAQTAHNEKFTKVSKQVMEYLREAKSLNDAVKRFPNIAMYVPDEFVKKMNEKVFKKSAEEKAADKEVNVAVDTSLLSVVAVAHTLGET